MKKYFLLAISIMLLGCEKEEVPEDQYNFDIDIEFSVKNIEGDDLLDPEYANGLAEEDIKLFFLIDGKKEEVFDADLDYPRNFLIFQHKNEYRMRVFPNLTNPEEKTITYIQWNETDTDTLGVTFQRNQNSTIRQGVWLNEELVFDKTNDPNSDPLIQIIK